MTDKTRSQRFLIASEASQVDHILVMQSQLEWLIDFNSRSKPVTR